LGSYFINLLVLPVREEGAVLVVATMVAVIVTMAVVTVAAGLAGEVFPVGADHLVAVARQGDGNEISYGAGKAKNQ
jgi:hypothetical protein